MRIGCNAFFLTEQATGTGQYTRHLTDALARFESSVQCLLYRPEAEKRPADSVAGDIHTLHTPFAPHQGDLQKLWFEQVAFPQACVRDRVDVAHVPYLGSPLFPSRPTVVTVHDLIPLLLPDYRRTPLVRAYNVLVSQAAQRANQVITDSRASQRDIIQHLRIPEERVHVVYLAADGMQVVRERDAVARVRARYTLPEEYILYLGGFDQRKNLRTLLAAYALLLQGDASVPPLVIAGRLPRVDSELFPSPVRIARELGIERQVVFVGWVAEEDKAVLYSAAMFFVFLSLYEGFGLMLLEAMSCGTPVLAARSSSLPEIVGDAGLLVDPQDAAGAAQAMHELLSNSALRASLAARGLERAATFTWDKTAEQTLAVYHLACGR